MKLSLPYAHNLKMVTVPVDATAGVTGIRTKLAGANKIYFLIAIAAGTAGTIQPTLKQHNAATSGTSKALSIAGQYYHKIGTATQFTKVDIVEGSELSVVDLGSAIAANSALVLLEVDASQLDVSNAFYWVSVDLPAIGQTRLTSINAVVYESHFKPAFSVDI